MSSSMFIDDVEKALEILKKRGREGGCKTMHVSDHITIYYEDREAGVSISNETSELNHVNMTYTWNNGTIQSTSTLIQIGDTSPYWLLNFDTTGLDISLTYYVIIRAKKTYYESQELNITIQLRRNQPIMGIVPPAPTVWGRNVTFNVTYTTLEGQFINAMK